MKNKFIKILLLVLTLGVTSCGNNSSYDFSDKWEVSFNLMGAKYSNSPYDVKHYYDKKDGGTLIIPLDDFNNKADAIKDGGYILKGWFTDETLTHEWNFATDKINSNMTLYAKWGKPYKYNYQAYRYDESHNLVPVVDVFGNNVIVEASEGESLYKKDIAKKLSGYTIINYYDEAGNAWNDEFVHPGGEGDLTIKVVIDYIEGIYSVVNTAKELSAATSSNIYLNADIDMNGEKLSFGNYTKTFVGNNHTISNFKVNVNPSNLVDNYEDDSPNTLYASLFGAAKKATISDVTFTNVELDIDSTYSRTKAIYASLLFAKVEECTISNVSITGNINIVKVPTLLDADSLHIESVNCYSFKSSSDTSQINNVTVNETTVDKR